MAAGSRLSQAPGGGPATGWRYSDRRLALLVAACCCVSVGNIYLALPLLPQIATDLHVEVGRIGIVETAGQIGYAIGLFLFVPLGDVVRRRRLIAILLAGACAGLLWTASSVSLPEIAVASFTFCALTVTAHILIPFVMDTVAPAYQARALAIIQSGITCGTIMSRVVGGAIGDVAGWRWVYTIMAGATACVVGLLLVTLPRQAPPKQVAYPRLIVSALSLLREEPVLRWSCLLQGMTFGAFTLIWTSVVLLLTRPPFDYSIGVAGLFGLLGLTTALGAPFSARNVERLGPVNAIVVGQCISLTATVVFAFAKHSVIFVIAGAILIYFGNQNSQMSNQLRSLRLRPDARSRVNMLIMTSTFVGGAIGSLVSTILFQAIGWSGVTTAASCVVLCSLTIGVVSRRLLARPVPADRPPAEDRRQACQTRSPRRQP
jgi:predicted MFS family arabinose efflux permease